MSYIFLCSGNKAERPYYVADLRKKLYTIEELCYYIYSNTALCGEELLKEKLARWIETECGYAELSRNIQIALKRDPRPERIAGLVFSYTDYLTQNEKDAVCEKIRKYSQMDMNERKKVRADYYVFEHKYQDAIRDYEDMLVDGSFDDKKGQHSIMFNIGCCYGKMFCYDLAFEWFMQASKLEVDADEDFSAALFCKRMVLSDSEFDAFLKSQPAFQKYALAVDKKATFFRKEFEKQPETQEIRQFEKGIQGKEYTDFLRKKLAMYKMEIS